MKNLWITFSLLVFCFSSCKKDINTETQNIKVTDSVTTEEPVTEPPLDSAAQMKAWVAYATPGSPHKMMADETGIWNCEMTFWMEPNGKPEKATSTATIKMILGGRYQEANYSGTMMGQPFEGKSTLAYNNASKEYTTTFIDNMGTGILTATGKYDEKTKSIAFKGDMVNPLNGKKTPYREIYTIVDATTRKMEMFDVKNGKEYKSMEIVMKKK
ncbi:DUF1579 domain-containing protein [Flavobacterium cupreum]|uniref:DUF1579 domain-containing protein n=1 Tax=Flavobacterium cupreum TaxID=2133766 RepID=A0A434A8B6_9FLAO|nr:DUF1579 domain-containing protein [Flavobacterium cupreum]RUT70586.1 DUF1579 domain-containing protein [Flavobacterium cupreum]